MIRNLPTRRGVRIAQGGLVLSEVLQAPGPTHSIVDVMAAAVQVLGSGQRVALLGFAGGGIVAPLRAMGNRQHLDAVDISRRNYGVFQKLCRSWCGPVTFHRAEAVTWLRQSRRRFGAIVEDLSVTRQGRVVQPALIWQTLPECAHHRLHSAGVAVFNLLHSPEWPWQTAIAGMVRPFAAAWVVRFEAFENQILVAGNTRLTTRGLAQRLRETLTQIGSRLATRMAVRSVSAGPH